MSLHSPDYDNFEEYRELEKEHDYIRNVRGLLGHKLKELETEFKRTLSHLKT